MSAIVSMPDEIEPEEENELPYLDSDQIRFVVNRVNEVRVSVEKIQQQNQAAIGAAAANLSIITSNQPDFRMPERSLNLLRFDWLFASNSPQTPLFSQDLLFPEIKRQISEIASALPKPELQLEKVFAGFGRLSEIIRLQIRELLRSIQFTFPPPDPRLSDVISAMDGDFAAAERLARRINWRPGQWKRECIRIKAQVERDSPEIVRKNALIQGVLLTLGGDKDYKVPISIGPKSSWLYDDHQNIATIDRFQLPMDYF